MKSGKDTMETIAPVFTSITIDALLITSSFVSSFSFASSIPCKRDSFTTFWVSIFSDIDISLPFCGGVNSNISLPLKVISPGMPVNVFS